MSEDHDKRIAELERQLAETEKYRAEQEEQRKKELAEQELQRAEQEKQREIELGKQEQERAQQEKQRFASELVKKYGVSANEKPVEVEEAPAKKELTGVRWLLVSLFQLVFAIGLILIVIVVVNEMPPSETTQTSKSSTTKNNSATERPGSVDPICIRGVDRSNLAKACRDRSYPDMGKFYECMNANQGKRCGIGF